MVLLIAVEKNQFKAKWSSVLGGYENLAKGQYVTAMGRNTLAIQDFCIAIGLQLNTVTFFRANQVGYWVLCAERIELCVGAGGDNSLVLTRKKFQKIQKHFEGNLSSWFGSKI